MARLELRLLGGLEAWIGPRPVAFATRHCALLLAWLALWPDQAHPRERLAGLLWPERSTEQARTSLRQAIHRLRVALEGADPFPLGIDGRALRLDGASLRCDLWELERAGPEDAEGLARAVGLLRGDLLQGLDPEDGELAAGLLAERARVRGVAVDRIRQLSARREAERRFGDVEALARRHLLLEPFDEAAWRQLMAAAARQGRRGAALAAFRDLSERLRAELSVAPEARTVALWSAIRNGALREEEAPARETAPAPRPVEAPRPEESAPPAPLGERRTMAVLHLSAAGLLAGALGQDPEVAAEVVGPALGRLEEVARRHGGRVVRTGAGEVAATFLGAERPALPAARAAMEARAATGARAGVHAGEAILDEAGDPGALGLVARGLAEAAQEGVALSEAARLDCDGYLSFAPGAPLALPGLEQPLPTWRPTGATGARNSWQARAGRGLTPLVGREAELGLLRRALGRSEAGAAVVVITGEAGMGKSRLLHEFLWACSAGRRVLETGAAAFRTEATHSALGLLLRSWAGVGPDQGQESETGPGRAWAAVEARLEELGAPAEARAPLRMLLDLPVADEAWASLSAGQRRRRVVDALCAILEREGRRQPVILAVEDAHWTDAETRQVLDALVVGLGAARVLVVVTARPEFRHGWGALSFVRQVRLEGLDGGETEQLLRGLLGDVPHRAELASRLHARTGGVPLFLEEVTRDLAEAGRLAELRAGTGAFDDPEGHPVPASIRGVLQLRIDRLPAEQRLVLQVAAVIGQTAPDSLLAPLCGLAPDALEEALDGLAAAELLYRTRGVPDREHGFKHALTQDAAYRGLLRRRREDLHRQVLRLLEERPDARRDGRAEGLARHAWLGGAWDEAARHLARAGERAVAHSDYRRARLLFERAVEALGRLPPSEGTRRRAVDLCLRLRAVLMLVGAYREVADTLGKAEALATPLEDPRLLVQVRTQVAHFQATDGGFAAGLTAAERAIAGADALQDPLLAAEARMAKGNLLRMWGNYRGALAELAPLPEVWSGAHRLHRGINIGTRSVFAHGHLAACLAYLGDREEARRAAALSREVARETRRPADLQFALLHDGIVTELEGRVADSVPLFEEALGIARTAELPYFEDWILVELGEALLALGEVGRALDLLEAACARPPEVVVGQFGASARAALGKAQVLVGRPDAAEATLREVLAYARRVGHRQLEQMALRRLATAVAARDLPAALALAGEAVAVAEAHDLPLGRAKGLRVRAALLARAPAGPVAPVAPAVDGPGAAVERRRRRSGGTGPAGGGDRPAGGRRPRQPA